LHRRTIVTMVSTAFCAFVGNTARNAVVFG
jgi:hypothetical protein